MKTVIWGTGYYASLFSLNIGRNKVDFYIDKDGKKVKAFLGKCVLTPDEISDWDNLRIYVPYNYYEEISIFLQSQGLVENEHFFKYDEMVYLTKEYIEKDFERACREVDELDFEDCKNLTGWYGRFWATKKEYKKCLKELKMGHDDFFILADTPWYKREEVESETKCHAVVMPAVMHDYVCLEDDFVDDFEHDGDVIDVTTRNLSQNIIARFKNVPSNVCMYKAKKCSEFMEYLFRRVRFKTFIIGDSDRAVSRLIRNKCEENRIPTLFTHQGIIPGTITMGPGGDIGNSVPCVHHKAFSQLPVDDKCVREVKRIWNYLKESKLNRKVQPCNDSIEKMKSIIHKDRPIVLYLGQNDIDSAMVPYTEESRKYQSPIFESSMSGLLYLAEICVKNKWNLVYKPHPMYAEFEDISSLLHNVAVIKFGDINELIDLADVAITIRSSSNYIALIRHKPVLMLGYTQTRGQGCTYEAFCKQDIEPQLKKALKYGFSTEQQEAFLIHLARLFRYYLYDDMSDRSIRYGLPLPKNVEEFFWLEKKMKSVESLQGKSV